MQAIIKKVNAIGLAEISAFLEANHKHYCFDRDALNARAAEAEFQLAEGNPASIEIKAMDSIYGRTQEFTVSDAGLDSENVEIDE